MNSALLILVLVVVAALAFDYINGFHDAANAVATVVSTGVLPLRTAILLAALLNFAGALTGTAVAATIGKGLIEPGAVTQVVVLSALLGRPSGTWSPGTSASRPPRPTPWSAAWSVPRWRTPGAARSDTKDSSR